MYQSYYTWLTCQVRLGWAVKTINMTLTPPPPLTGKATSSKYCKVSLTPKLLSVTKWHKVIGELHSMALALTGAHGIFSRVQESLCHIKFKRFTLMCGYQEALEYLWLISANMDDHPKKLFKLFPLTPTVNGYYDASGYM